ncbi:MAG: DNA replication/repair protein RecF [Alphaproteobacteria bacterium]|nr:DNA replication/repair protein RecF [Alphaproteobacteria bacterium]
MSTPEAAPSTSGSAPRCPALVRLSLAGFRNHARLELRLEPRSVVLIGPNGVGKTNLLEAISLLAPGRGLRRAGLGELLGPAATAWAIGATLQGLAGVREVATALEATGRGDRRVATLDGGARRGPVSLAGVLPLLWLTPAMDRLFVEGAGNRRRFLDRLVYGLDPAHAERLQAYDRALRERLTLLRAGRRDPAWLTALEARLAADGVAIAAARVATVERLGAALAVEDGPFPAADLALVGEMEAALATTPALAVEEGFATRLARNRATDAEAGTTTVGPHRSDLAVSYRARGTPARLASTGEQKALLIAILLGQARVASAAGLAPVLLLDEVAAHLDEARRRALFDRLAAHPGQVWLTGTEAALFAGTAATCQGIALAGDGWRMVDLLP